MIENFYYGLSGIVLPIAKKSFPPEHRDKSRLEYYATLFNSLEVNSCFYKLPQPATVAKWVACVPPGFKFTFKLSKEITHSKDLVFKDELIKAFMDTIKPAAAKNACILIQFPPSLHIERLNELQSLLSEVSFYNEDGWDLAVEFRHHSWYEREVIEILNEHRACMVLHDLPASSTPPEYAASDIVYLRFHGPTGGYRGSYDPDFLNSFAAKINAWLACKKRVYCYFNNTMGDAVNNLQTLVNRVTEPT